MLTRIAPSAPLTPAATRAPAPAPPRPCVLDRRETSVLVIDDHADSRIVVRIVLEQAGFSVVDAQTGVDGLQTALDLQPRVVLLDMVLPGLDGWEIARRLRRNERTARCAIIAVTALDGERDHDRARAAGCDDVLVKPVPPSTILGVIADLVGLPGSRAARG